MKLIKWIRKLFGVKSPIEEYDIPKELLREKMREGMLSEDTRKTKEQISKLLDGLMEEEENEI